METVMSILVGIFFAVAIYLMLSKHSIRMLLGVAVLGNAVNLLLFVSGRITRDIAPIMAGDQAILSPSAANPLPQALILTAIVISFSFFAFLLVLTWRAFQDLKTDNTDDMRHAEPEGQAMPPLSW